jgi:hypothetical protein
VKRTIGILIVAASLLAGLATGQDGRKPKPSKEELARLQAEADEKYKKVRRVVKRLDYDKTLKLVPKLEARETEYLALVRQIHDGATGGSDVTSLLEKAYQMKLKAFQDLSRILLLHRGKYAGIDEEQVLTRLNGTRLEDVDYEEEWLVNILDDLEESMQVNIEIDARIYKFDVVSFTFTKTTARAMLQTMADSLLFKWIVRGDTLYIYKERHEDLFNAAWLAKKRAAWKARKKTRQDAAKRADDAAKKAPKGD